MNQEKLRSDNTLLHETESVRGMTPMAEEPRDFKEEIRELLRYYPEMIGQKLPDAVIRAALAGKSLLYAYEDYRSGMLREENTRLQRELAALRQNGISARQAPVRAVSGGEGIRNRAEDAFLRGFNE